MAEDKRKVKEEIDLLSKGMTIAQLAKRRKNKKINLFDFFATVALIVALIIFAVNEFLG